jgi:hypothetical protein
VPRRRHERFIVALVTEIYITHAVVVLYRAILGEVVGQILSVWLPLDDKVIQLYLVANPVIAHLVRVFLVDSAISDTNSALVVTDDDSGFLGVAKVSECVACTCGLASSQEYRSILSSYCVDDDATEVVNSPANAVHWIEGI